MARTAHAERRRPGRRVRARAGWRWSVRPTGPARWAGCCGTTWPTSPAKCCRSARRPRSAASPAYADLRDVPGEVDLAVIATPAATVPGIVRAAAAKHVTAVVVLSAGFAETGAAGAKLQAEAVAVAQSSGVRLVGPNCFGVQNADLPLNASISAGTPRGGGGVSIVTQSGSYGMAVHALGRDEGLRVAKVFAAGNKADITDAELLGYLRQDPATTRNLPAARVDHRRPRVLRRGLPDHAGQAGHRGGRRAHRSRAAGRGVAHRRAGHRRRGARRGAAPGRGGPGAHRAAGTGRGPGPVRPADAARSAGGGGDQLRRHRRRADRPAGRRGPGGAGAERAAAGRNCGPCCPITPARATRWT